jgi:hypothetical protein
MDMGRKFSPNLQFILLWIGPFVFFVASVCVYSGHAVIRPDSASYINFYAIRTIGYPVFIWFFRRVLGSIDNIVYIQLLFFSASVLFLVWRLSKCKFGWFLVVGAEVSTFLVPFLTAFHYQILTESLFFSLTNIFLGLIVMLINNPRKKTIWIWLGIVAAIATTVRPVGASYIPVTPVMAVLFWWFLGEGYWKATGCSLMTSIFILAVFFGGVAAVRGSDQGPSLLSTVMFAKSALVAAGSSPYPSDDIRAKLWDRLEADGKAVRDLLEKAGEVNMAVESELRGGYEVYFEYEQGQKIMSSLPVKGKDINDLKLKVSLRRLFDNPVGYLGLSLHNFVDLWSAFSGSFPLFVRDGNQFILNNSPLPLNATEKGIFPKMEAQPIAALAFPLLMMVGVISFSILLLAFSKRFFDENLRRLMILPVALSLMINGNFLLVALTGVGIARYSLAMFPSMVLMLLSLAVFILGIYLSRKHPNDLGASH